LLMMMMVMLLLLLLALSCVARPRKYSDRPS
jgi:hypothetical protein